MSMLHNKFFSFCVTSMRDESFATQLLLYVVDRLIKLEFEVQW